jgi:exodeoxyribonuclease V alpha subunit
MGFSSIAKEEQTFEGIVVNIIFHNDENGFTVFALSENNKNNKDIICTGNLPRLIVGETVKLSGSYVKSPKYGQQLSVHSLEKSVPTSQQDIEKYLGSGVITGIGKVLAKRIVERFGEQTLEIMDETPERLAEIKGITCEKAAKIGIMYHEKSDERRAVLFLQNYDISPIFANRIYKKYGEATQDIVKTNPYKLADEIYGIGFKTADVIASKVGIAFDSTLRVKAGLKYCLSHSSTQGHVFFAQNGFIGRSGAIAATLR